VIFVDQLGLRNRSDANLQAFIASTSKWPRGPGPWGGGVPWEHLEQIIADKWKKLRPWEWGASPKVICELVPLLGRGHLGFPHCPPQSPWCRWNYALWRDDWLLPEHAERCPAPRAAGARWPAAGRTPASRTAGEVSAGGRPALWTTAVAPAAPMQPLSTWIPHLPSRRVISWTHYPTRGWL
jgi:hypothetical protein